MGWMITCTRSICATEKSRDRIQSAGAVRYRYGELSGANRFSRFDLYRESNTGIPYVHSFDSGVPGPHVMVNALTHGNEVCGAIVVKALLDLGVRPRHGRLTLAFANVEAYKTFDLSRPDASRYVTQDFNRVWTPSVLDDKRRECVELRRARAMRPLINTVDLLLDLHSMHECSAPLLLLSGPLDKGIARAVSGLAAHHHLRSGPYGRPAPARLQRIR
jgi:predicted deacylase